MRRKDDTGVGDFEDAFSPVPHASGFRTILSLATQHHMLCDHVDISQAFVQGDLLPGDGHNGKVYICRKFSKVSVRVCFLYKVAL